MADQYQNIILTLSTGKKICATVPAFIKRGERVSVETVEVTDCKSLPEDCKWEALE